MTDIVKLLRVEEQAGWEDPMSDLFKCSADETTSLREANKEFAEALEAACASAENQACWDKRPWCGWYYDAKRILSKHKGELK